MDKTDYRNQGFIHPIEEGDSIGYASIHSVLYRDEDGLDVTGNYFVYLLHPKFGSTHFTLEPTTAHSMRWKKNGGAVWLEKSIVQEIITQIELRRG